MTEEVYKLNVNSFRVAFFNGEIIDYVRPEIDFPTEYVLVNKEVFNQYRFFGNKEINLFLAGDTPLSQPLPLQIDYCQNTPKYLLMWPKPSIEHEIDEEWEIEITNRKKARTNKITLREALEFLENEGNIKTFEMALELLEEGKEEIEKYNNFTAENERQIKQEIDDILTTLYAKPKKRIFKIK